jgi:hypothetical protein
MIAVAFSTLSAQVVAKGDVVLNLGIGFKSTLYSQIPGYTGTIPPVSGSVEFVFKDGIFDGKGALGIGGQIAYSGYKFEEVYREEVYGFKYSNVIIGPRGYLHYNFIPKLDTYGGIMFGYNFLSTKNIGDPSWVDDSFSQKYGGTIFSGFLGARYFFSDKIAGLIEFGTGISVFNVGLSFKL